MDIGDAVMAIASVNGLSYGKTGPRTWSIFKPEKNSAANRAFTGNTIEIDSTGMITAKISGGNIGDIIPEVLDRLERNYFISENISS